MAKKKYPEVTLTRAPRGLDTPLSEVFDASVETPVRMSTAITHRRGAARASAARPSTSRVKANEAGFGRFTELGLETVEELLRYYPRRFVGGTSLTALAADLASEEQREAVFYARVRSGEHVPTRKRRADGRKVTFYRAIAEDEAGTTISMSFFNQPWADRWLTEGSEGYFFGKVSVRRPYGLTLAHPDFHRVSGTTGPEAAYASGLLPIYPATARADSWGTGIAILQVLDAIGEIEDPLPAWVRDAHGFCTLAEALEGLHRPRRQADWQQALRRLRYEEAFVLQAELVRRRNAVAQLPAQPRAAADDGLLNRLDARLPYELTTGQRDVSEQIATDLARPHPMQRLLQGDVGSGKTVVALRAMLTVVDSGGQAALLAPTEVLAQQHYRTIRELLGPLAERGMLGGADEGTAVALLTGSQQAADRRRQLLEVASGEAGIVVGTHALLQEKVEFADLGLVVVDEQHRFGVEQRAALSTRTSEMPPHVLVMTATPIPRTVAMTIFGDLATSTLAELPAGRPPTDTVVVDYQKPSWAERTWQRVREEVDQGRQVYVVCPRISTDSKRVDAEEVSVPAKQPTVEPTGEPADLLEDDTASEDTAASALVSNGWAVIETTTWLRDGPLAGLSVAELHGRMPASDKDAVMRQFAAGEVDVLVSTTVIEVGVDVPNASTMVILDADWFGVSQLHQLRGRVGRGTHRGLCLLVHRGAQGGALERLDALARNSDGFELSRVDMHQRREGDILGSSQHGIRSTLKLLSVRYHEDVIEQARQDAVELADRDPGFDEHPELVRMVDVLYGESHAEFLQKS